MRKRLFISVLGATILTSCSLVTKGHEPTRISRIPESEFIDFKLSPLATATAPPIIYDTHEAKEHYRKPKVVVATPAREVTTKAPTFTAPTSSPKKYALSRLGPVQFSCIDNLWTRESHWRTHAHNKSSGAYGIPQALPGNKMETYGADWRDNPITQVKWGIHYVNVRYGSACGAWNHFQKYNWY